MGRPLAVGGLEVREEPEQAGLETLLRGACAPARFLDLVENFVIFQEVTGGLRKVVGKQNKVQSVAWKQLADPARGCKA